MTAPSPALRFSLGYALAGLIWFAACGQLLAKLDLGAETDAWIDFFLDAAFVSVSAALLYFDIPWSVKRYSDASGRAADANGHAARQPLLAVAFLLITIGIIGLTLYHSVKKQIATGTTSNLQSISRLKANQVNLWLDEAHNDGSVLLNSISFRTELQTWLDNGKRGDKFGTYLLTRLKEVNSIGRFDALSLYDQNGVLMMSTKAATNPDRHGEILKATLEQGEAGIDKLYSSYALAGPRGDIGYYRPLLDTTSSRPIAILHVALDPKRMLYPAMEQWPASSASAETLLLNRVGDAAVPLNALRHHPATPSNSTPAPDPSSRVETKALNGHSGPIVGIDYRMHPCLAYSIPIAGTSLTILAKIDEAEVFATFHSLARFAAAAVVIQLLVTGWWLSKYHRAMESRNRAQAAHLQISDRLETLVKHANDCIIVLDENNRIIDANDRCQTTYGYSNEEMLSLSGLDLFAREEDGRLQALRQRYAAEGQLLYVAEHKRKDGSTFPVETSLVVMNAGGMRRTQKIIRDISERKANEQQLLQSNEIILKAAEEIQDLYQNAPCGYHSLNADGLFLRINNTELDWLGYSRDELVGKMRFHDLLEPDGAERFDKAYHSLRRSGETADLDLELVGKDGKRLPVLLTTTIIRDKEGSILTIRSTLYNMTERMKIEDERLEYSMRMDNLSRRLVSAQEASKRELSAALHDQTSPNLAAIEINLNVIAKLLSSGQNHEISAILDDTSALVADTTISIREICAELRPSLLDYAGLVPTLEGYAIQFSRRTGTPVRIKCAGPSPGLDSDKASLLFRIAQEAMTNCAKHAHATMIEVGLSHADGATVLTVADNGKGFNPELLGKNGEEVGMGVLNMREISEFIGGRLHIETAPGQGTTIRVELARSNIAMDEGELA